MRSSLGAMILPAIRYWFVVLIIITRHQSSALAMGSTITSDATAYNNYASAAVDISQAHYTPSSGLLTFIRSVRDIDSNKRRKFLYSITDTATTFFPPCELNDRIMMRIPSPSGDKIAIVVKQGEDSQQVLELWTRGGQFLKKRILLPKKMHGSVISDAAGGFGSPSWNSQETALVYAAERIAPETSSFFADIEHHDNDAKQKQNRGKEFTLGFGRTERWGEKYGKQAALLDLFCVHVETGKVGRIENVPGAEDKSTTLAGYSLGQVVWSPDGKSVVYVAWDAGGGQQMPRRLGLVYCMQRPSKVYCSSVVHLMKALSSTEANDYDNECKDGAYQVLTPNLRVARSPRFSPVLKDGTSQLVFLSAQRPFDSHLGCFGLDAIHWKDDGALDGSHRVLVPQVWDPNESSSGDEVAGLPFPGLFMVELPDKCFLTPDLLLATTQWGSCQKVVRISTVDGHVKIVKVDDDFASTSLLSVAADGSAFLSSTAPNKPVQIYHVPSSILLSEKMGNENACPKSLPNIFSYCASRFSVVDESPCLDFSYDIHTLDDVPKVDGKNDKLTVQSILLLPNKDHHPNPPVIVVPHGGPHSASSTSYSPALAYLCGHGGYALLLVNYRGSIGFGQASVEALPSKCGDMDVKDCMAATEQLKMSGLVDTSRIGVCGGSHGGFLTAHCTSQYPNYFKAAAMRNPVVNIAR